MTWMWIGYMVSITICLVMMFRPLEVSGDSFAGVFEVIARIAWLIPILFLTAVYFAILYWMK